MPIDKKEEQPYQEKQRKQSEQKLDLQVQQIILSNVIWVVSVAVQHMLPSVAEIDRDGSGGDQGKDYYN